MEESMTEEPREDLQLGRHAGPQESQIKDQSGQKLGWIGKFFLWCSGSDPKLLQTSAERTKYIGLGTLVVVPAVLASFAMTYAISTLAEGWLVPVLAGLAWALIVFCFDRYIVSTFRKSTSLATDLVSPIFLTRFVLAGFVGVIVAHPLVLLYFRDSIDEELQRQRAAAQQAIEEAYAPRFQAITDQRDALQRQLQAQEQVRLGAQELLMEEISGIASEKTTGRYGRGPAAEAKEELRDLAEQDLARLRGALEARAATLDAQMQDLDARRLAERSAPQALDYIARARALEALRARSPELVRVHAFLLLFFVFVDTLPLIFKTLSPRGPYDDRLALEEQRAFAAGERGRHSLYTVYQEMDRARSSPSGRHEAQRRGLPVLYGELMDNLERHQVAVRGTLRREQQGRGEGLSEDQQEAQRAALARIDAANLRTVARTVEQFEEAFLGSPPTEPAPLASPEQRAEGLGA
jgi:hypothetical protein